MNVQLVNNEIIDLKKWDACIDSCINAMPYAYSWYLNIVCVQKWDAIILDDYKAVFPLPLKSFFFYSKIYQPFFTQQLGLFYTDKKYLSMLDTCIDLIKKKYSKIYLHLNTKNNIGGLNHRITYHVNLHHPFEEIASNFSKRVLKNLKAIELKKCVFSECASSDIYVEFMKQHLGDKLNALKQKDFLVLKKLMDTCVVQQAGKIYCIRNQNNEIVAGAFILIKNSYLIYLAAASSQEGKKLQAMTFLIYSLMKQFSTKNDVFDFEGSMIESIANFYEGFGAEKKYFPVLEK